jgi:ABC-type uncharacterized transport system fused permease/ATPase subunit
MSRGREAPMNNDWKRVAARLDELLQRLEKLLPASADTLDWKRTTAFRWRKLVRGGYLEAVRHPHTIRFEDLKDVDEQKRRLRENTAQFVAGRPANNVLLTGARGTGKSSMVKAALNEFAPRGLRTFCGCYGMPAAQTVQGEVTTCIGCDLPSMSCQPSVALTSTADRILYSCVQLIT